MNGAAYRALAAVLSAAAVSDRESYLARRPQIDRARLDEAIAVFDGRFGRRRWRALADRQVLRELLQSAEQSAHSVILEETGKQPDAGESAMVISADTVLPPKARRALNSILSVSSDLGSH